MFTNKLFLAAGKEEVQVLLKCKHRLDQLLLVSAYQKCWSSKF